MRIFHVAELTVWEAARTAGAYAVSTRGRTLEDEGFIHAAREEQVAGVLERYWSDHPGPLVLLAIDTDLLTPELREDAAGDETFPHILGPINLSAVVDVQPVPQAPRAPRAQPAPTLTFAQVWLAEFSFRTIAAVIVMAFAVTLGLLAAEFVDDRAGLAGLVLGLLIGLAAVLPIARRRRRDLS